MRMLGRRIAALEWHVRPAKVRPEGSRFDAFLRHAFSDLDLIARAHGIDTGEWDRAMEAWMKLATGDELREMLNTLSVIRQSRTQATQEPHQPRVLSPARRAGAAAE